MGAAVLGVLINRATIPQARVVFSDNCLFTSRDGEPVLILRIGNTRGNFLLNPEIRIGLLTVRHPWPRTRVRFMAAESHVSVLAQLILKLL